MLLHQQRSTPRAVSVTGSLANNISSFHHLTYSHHRHEVIFQNVRLCDIIENHCSLISRTTNILNRCKYSTICCTIFRYLPILQTHNLITVRQESNQCVCLCRQGKTEVNNTKMTMKLCFILASSLFASISRAQIIPPTNPHKHTKVVSGNGFAPNSTNVFRAACGHCRPRSTVTTRPCCWRPRTACT
jgi:hypothetical protein